MVILINPFVVTEGREAEFLDLWERTDRIFRAAPGFISARLCRASPEQAPGQSPPFTHVNLAEWESVARYAGALRSPELRGFAARYRQVSSFDPALYVVIRGG